MDKKKCIIDKYSTAYCFDLYVIVNPDKNIVDKKFRFREDESSILDGEWVDYTAFTAKGAYDKESGKDCEIIVVNKKEDSAPSVNTFAHEAFHAAVDILESCHIRLTDDTNEVYAYLIGHFAECIFKTAGKV